MKLGFYFILTIGLVVGAYSIAQQKLHQPLHLSSLRLGMELDEVEAIFGTPSARSRNQITYVFDDGSELFLTLRDEKISIAKVKFQKIIKIQDPEMKKLTLVQMEASNFESNNPSWFYAGKPSEGLIYKITSDGTIESLTWVPPFSYSNNQAKNLQALLRDFQSQRSL